MKFLLIRHGKTEYNREMRYQGRTDLPLSEEGRAELIPASGFSPDVVYVTPLKRTSETAEILFPGIPRVVVPGTSEMDFGVFEGRNYKEMADDPDYRAWIDSQCMDRCPNGEIIDEYVSRVGDALVPLLDQAVNEGRELLVMVAHGGTQMVALSEYNDPPRPYFSSLAKNGEGLLFDVDKERWLSAREFVLKETIPFTKTVTEGKE